MRAVLATAVAALAAAAPAAAVTVPKSISGALRVSSAATIAAATTKSDKLHSCQAGDRRARTAETSAVQTERKAAVVACEQPPGSNLLTPDAVAKATAAALSVIG